MIYDEKRVESAPDETSYKNREVVFSFDGEMLDEMVILSKDRGWSQAYKSRLQ